jgi:hypothetical protein
MDRPTSRARTSFDGPHGDFQFPFLATVSNPEPDVLTRLFVEHTDYGPTTLTIESLAVDARYEIALLRRLGRDDRAL